MADHPADCSCAQHLEQFHVRLVETSIVHTEAAPGTMDEFGVWAFKRAGTLDTDDPPSTMKVDQPGPATMEPDRGR